MRRAGRESYCAPLGAQLAAGWLGTLRPARLESGECTHSRESGAYHPPRALRHLITIRQQTCSFPGCRRSATRCDLDHSIPYHLGGKTCECNLAPRLQVLTTHLAILVAR
jgi:hypothetical protein